MDKLSYVVFLLLCLFYTGSESTLVRRPLNTAVVQGSSATLHCSSDDSDSFLYWYNSLCVTIAQSIGDCTNDRIYNGFNVVDNCQHIFSVSAEKNATHVTRDLNIDSTQLTDAGEYLCGEVRRGVSIVDTSSAQLIVLAGDTECITSLSASGTVQENGVITVTCSITYSGNWAPDMTWSNSRHNFTDDEVTLATNSTTATSQRMVAVSADLQGSEIECETHFSQPSTSLPTTATNMPSYRHTWTSPTLDVQYAPRNLQIIPRNSVYHQGVRIECSAAGNPASSYQWTNLISGYVIQGSVLVISENMTDKNHAFHCTATTSTSTVNSAALLNTYKSAMIVLAVIAGVAIAIAVLLTVYIVKKIHTKAPKQSGHSAAVTESASSVVNDAYQELSTMPDAQPIYSQLSR